MNTRTLPELILQLQQAFAGFLGMDPDQVNADMSIKELGMDSLTAVELALDIEERLGVSLFLTDFTGRETIAGLAASFIAEQAA